jgi:stearoyl-CoA desaturase (delta-9 desaturase)
MTYFITEALGHGFVGFPLTIFLPNPGISIFKLCLAYVTFMSYLGIGMSVCLHRYFSHQAFKTSRSMTFLLAVIGSLANQKGCLWWAANHRKHHKYCDQPGDPHSQTQDGYWFGFVGWSFVYHETELAYVPNQFLTPELLFLNQFHWLPKTILIASLWCGLGYEWAFWGYILPAFLCTFGSLKFNIKNHPMVRINPEKICNSVDDVFSLSQIAYLLGEHKHDHHHQYPTLARRPGPDLPYHLFLRPLFWTGLIW